MHASQKKSLQTQRDTLSNIHAIYGSENSIVKEV